MSAYPTNLSMPKLLLVLLAMSGAIAAQSAAAGSKTAKPGVKGVQVPFASLKPTATFKIGETADWVLVTKDAVWVAGTKPFSLQRIDPATNKIVTRVLLPGEACSGLAFGFGSVWVPICAKQPALVRVDAGRNRISATLRIAPAGPEGGITASADSIWIVSDKKGTLNRIEPSTNKVRQRISIRPGSYNPVFSNGIVWISGVESSVLAAVDAATGRVLQSVAVGLNPRFLTVGGGSVWTLNQGDGTVTRVDENSRKVMATIRVGIPGAGGDLDYGDESVWATVFEVPLTRIDAVTGKVVKQWVGHGGDSLRFGFGSIWITDYKRGLVCRIPEKEVLSP
jgi:virginiamycin B lyase